MRQSKVEALRRTNASISTERKRHADQDLAGVLADGLGEREAADDS
jgi:hypothetical protein